MQSFRKLLILSQRFSIKVISAMGTVYPSLSTPVHKLGLKDNDYKTKPQGSNWSYCTATRRCSTTLTCTRGRSICKWNSAVLHVKFHSCVHPTWSPRLDAQDSKISMAQCAKIYACPAPSQCRASY